MEHGDAIRELQDRERQLVRKDALILKMKDRDIRRRAERRQLQEELRRARNNIGELNSMIVRLERSLESVRRAHENQAKTIAAQAQELTTLRRKQELAEQWRQARDAAIILADGFRDQVEELQSRLEDEPDNLALTACKKKLEQLEGMLEGQRRSTRELGVNLQNTRDVLAGTREDLRAITVERDQWQKRAQVAEEKIAETRAQTMVPVGRLQQALRERNDYLKQLQDLQARRNRALSMIRRAVVALDPVKVTEAWDGDTRIEWTEGSMGSGVTVTPQAKKAEPLHQCGGLNGSHSCTRLYNPGGSPPHPPRHRCHCGFTWPW